MTGPAPARCARVAMDDDSSIAVARSVTRNLAHAVGLGDPAADEAALAASELATNIRRHAGRGELVVVPRGPALSLLALDDGPGVADFERCLVDGYSTGGTLGAGLGAVRRLADEFEAFSEPGRGTVVAATFGVREPELDVAGLDFPIRGEVDNGDSWTVLRRGSHVVALLADGLGHGGGAALASRSAVRGLHELPELAPGDLVGRLHERLRAGRGAAVTVCATDLASLREGGTAVSAGLGNVSLAVVGRDGSTVRAVTTHGTVGLSHGVRAREQSSEVPPGGLLVLHSDGLGARWDLAGRPDLLRHSALVVAGVLLREQDRGSDDVAVLVVGARR